MKIVEIKSDVQALKEDLQEMLEIGGSMMHTVSEMCAEMGGEDEGQSGRRMGRRMGRRSNRRSQGYPGGGYGYRGRMDDEDYDPMYDD